MKNSAYFKGVFSLIVVFAFYIIAYSVLYVVGFVSEIPSNTNVLNWDGSWYYSIVTNGYFLDLENQSNAGFFPGFPYLWRFLGASPLLISFINGAFFITGLLVLKKITNSSWKSFLVLFSLPSSFFFFLPYSEAMFYFFSVFFIHAWMNKNNKLIITFAILLSFVRPVFFFLIPAFIALNFFYQEKDVLKKSIRSIVALLIGAILGFIIIGFETGDFFAYSKSQVNHWNHEFKLPSFPLTTWRGYRILWLDALAIFVAISALIYLVKSYFFKKLKKLPFNLSQLEVIGLSYLIMILIYVLFFHPVEDGRTTVLSVNRYVFCNPFLHYILLKRIQSFNFRLNSFILPIFTGLIVLLLFGIPFYSIIGLDYKLSVIFGIGLFFYLLFLTLIVFNFKYHNYYVAIIIFSNILLHFYLLNSFLKANWIG